MCPKMVKDTTFTPLSTSRELVLTVSEQGNIPLEPARAGAQDSSMINNTATDPGMEMPMSTTMMQATQQQQDTHSRCAPVVGQK